MDLVAHYLERNTGHILDDFLREAEEPDWVSFRDFIGSEESMVWAAVARRGGKTSAAMNKAIYTNRNVYYVCNNEHTRRTIVDAFRTDLRCLDIEFEDQHRYRVRMGDRWVFFTTDIGGYRIEEPDNLMIIFDDAYTSRLPTGMDAIDRLRNWMHQGIQIVMISSYGGTDIDNAFVMARSIAEYQEVRSFRAYGDRYESILNEDRHTERAFKLELECDFDGARAAERGNRGTWDSFMISANQRDRRPRNGGESAVRTSIGESSIGRTQGIGDSGVRGHRSSMMFMDDTMALGSYFERRPEPPERMFQQEYMAQWGDNPNMRTNEAVISLNPNTLHSASTLMEARERMGLEALPRLLEPSEIEAIPMESPVPDIPVTERVRPIDRVMEVRDAQFVDIHTGEVLMTAESASITYSSDREEDEDDEEES